MIQDTGNKQQAIDNYFISSPFYFSGSNLISYFEGGTKYKVVKLIYDKP
jgi:hypothetical protein